MFPIEFDHTILDGLPLPGEADIKRVVQILKAVIMRRVIPYFRKKRGTDPILAAHVGESLMIERLEDAENRVRATSLITPRNGAWALRVHERVFDYLAFVIPSRPESSLGQGTPEERKMLAFAEFMLRHEIEHILYPQSTESEVLISDAAFGMDRRANDPTFYRALRSALADEMNGLKGESYLALFDCAEQEQPLEPVISRILGDHSTVLADLPEGLVQEVFPSLCPVLKTRVLGLCFQRSRDTTYSLLRRTYFLQKCLRLFELLVSGDPRGVQEVFGAFKERWGLVYLLHELGLPEASVENKSDKEIFELVKESLKQFSEETKGLYCPVPPRPPAPRVEPKPSESTVKSLKDRIEEARNNPAFPSQVVEVIDKNKLNAVGHSGSKYSELIETLLAIPWGKIQKIKVQPEQFEQGLNSTHYGLEKPKEIILDFFSSLIWRYHRLGDRDGAAPYRSGSAFLFVGPPGVGKTSLAISIATNLGIPYHKLSLGGMRDEADLRGHGFTYEGSKPGAIVQGLIKMECMNGMFIMDEADKTEKFAIATLLEILDPEQNHLFHDKYTQTTVDIDLSNAIFVLTANTLETVPPPVVNRCEVVLLDRYSVDEKISIAQQHLIQRIRERYQISEDQIFFDPEHEARLLRYLIKVYTHEAGVRELERLLRTLFMRILRKEILAKKEQAVTITREKIAEHLETPRGSRQINEEDRVGEVMALGINVELGVGSIIPIQATPIQQGRGDEERRSLTSTIHATGNIERIMDESRRVATTAILHCAQSLGIRRDRTETPIHLHFMGGSTPKDGPSAGGAIALALASVLAGRRIRRDVAMTGEIDTQGRISMIGGLELKLEIAYDAGSRTMIIPKENLYGDGGIERLSEALKRELQVLSYEAWKGPHDSFDYSRHLMQVVGVDRITQAAEIAFIDDEELDQIETCLIPHARSVAEALAANRHASRPPFRALYVKDVKELEQDGSQGSLWENGPCVFLVQTRSEEAIRGEFPILEERKRLWGFDPAFHDVTAVLREMAEAFGDRSGSLVPSSLVAPFFFLYREKERLDGFSPGPSFEQLRLFANNFTVQEVKFRACKAVLNRVYYYLSLLDSRQLDACPFLGKRDGIYVVDMSFIPEKYRLDLKRAEELLIVSLKRWLMTLESSSSASETQISTSLG